MGGIEFDLDDFVQNADLHHKITNSVYIIKESLKKYSYKNVAIAFNGGKDSVVLICLIHYTLNEINKSPCEFFATNDIPLSLSRFRTLFFSFSDSFNQVTEFMWNFARDVHLNITIIENGYSNGLKDFLSHCDDNDSIKAIFMGTRHCDPHAAELSEFSMTDSNWPQLMRINPIIAWTYSDIWNFILHSHIPFCSLYTIGYTSIGSICDTSPNPELWDDEKKNYKPAWLLKNDSSERLGRNSK